LVEYRIVYGLFPHESKNHYLVVIVYQVMLLSLGYYKIKTVKAVKGI
jgi:hypothetical protein